MRLVSRKQALRNGWFMVRCGVGKSAVHLLLAFLLLGSEFLFAAERAPLPMSRQRIRQLLGQIVLEEVPPMEGFTLREAAEVLGSYSRRGDPSGVGINFIINENVVNLPRGGQTNRAPVQPLAPVPPMIDPNTGLPIPQPQPVAPVAPAKGIDGDAVKIKGLTAPLRRVTLGQLLDAVVKSCDVPVRVSIEEYAVVFMHKNPEAQETFTRTFRANPNTFGQGLTPAGKGQPGGPSGN
jgi:hypothetical protein